MPGASFVRAACFAIGAIVGGGTVAAVELSRRRKEQPIREPTVTSEQVQLGEHGTSEFAITTSGAKVPGTVLKYGHPGPISDLLIRRAYVTAYDRRMRHPAWTAEHLTLSSLGKSPLETKPLGEKKGDRLKSNFTEDGAILPLFRSRSQDYYGSGYDRGHMVPAADAKASQVAMDETFLLTNIAPQVGEQFNRHYWAYLEDWCRRLTNNFQDVYVFTIPLYLPKLERDGKWRVTYEVIGSPPNVAVPTHFAKVVLTSKPSSPSTPNVPEISTGAFVLPNAAIPDETPLEQFVVPVEAVERAAGLTLFPEALKSSSKHICKTTKCEVIVRRFDDARKSTVDRKLIAPPPSK